MAEKRPVLAREVVPEVRAAALAPRERGLGQEARQQDRRAAEALEALGVANQARVLPELLPQLGAHGRLGRTRGRGTRGSDRLGAECGLPGAAAEDEALEQRVGGEPVRAMDAGRRALT